MKKSTVFEETYNKYLSHISDIDLLPRIPIRLRFNDKDDEFPAQCSLLFRQSAESYIDMESLAIGGTYLTGMLTKA